MRRFGPPQLGSVVSSAARQVLAACAMGAVLWTVADMGPWERGGNDPATIGGLALLVVLGACVYAGAAFALRVPELLELYANLRRGRSPKTP